MAPSYLRMLEPGEAAPPKGVDQTGTYWQVGLCSRICSQCETGGAEWLPGGLSELEILARTGFVAVGLDGATLFFMKALPIDYRVRTHNGAKVVSETAKLFLSSLVEGEEFVATKKLNCWELVEKVLPSTEKLLLYGPPGTGKTWTATKAGNLDGQAVCSVTLHEDADANELRGHWIPEGNKFVWQDGIAIRAWRNGSRLVINEIDHASADVLSILLAILDDKDIARLTLPNGETITPHADFKVVATMNGKPSDLPPPLRDRFPLSIFINSIHPEALNSLSEDLRPLASKGVLVADEERRSSVRAWKAFDLMRSDLGEPVSAQACFGAQADDVINTLKLARGKEKEKASES